MSALAPRSGAATLLRSQADGDNDYDGHFIDDFIDTITNVETSRDVIDWVATVLEWGTLIGLFVGPVLLVVGASALRRWTITVGATVFVGLMIIYRWVLPEDWEPRQNTVLNTWNIPVGDWVEQVTRWVDLNLKSTLEVIEWPFSELLRIVNDEWLLQMSWIAICAAVLVLGWLFRGPVVGLMSALALVICGLLGQDYWLETARTIGFISVAVLLCAVIGIPLGVLCGRVDGAWTVVRPVLDAMQVVHSFVYMLPFIFFFGIGPVSATMVTMVFALPPLIRLTNLGIRQVPGDVVEAARAYGASELRVLTDVQLPLARPALLTGLNQTLLLSISMLGIAAIMGAGGLGRLLFRAISNLDIALAGSGGLAFFLVAVVLDRLTQPSAGERRNIFSRIIDAWAHRRDPEQLLPTQDESNRAQTASNSGRRSLRRSLNAADEPADDDDHVSLTRPERQAVWVATVAAAAVAVFAVVPVFPWNSGSGLISAYARFSDLALDGAFGGIEASGGSWLGLFVAATSAAAVAAGVHNLVRPGGGSRWLGPDGAVIFTLAAIGGLFGFAVISPPAGAAALGRDWGFWLASLAAVAAASAALRWLWLAPMAARVPLSPKISYGKIAAAVAAVVLVVAGGYSGWTFDTREGSVITPELQAELDEIERQADAAVAQGDQVTAATLSAEIIAKRSEAVRKGDVVLDGYTSEGAGLGWWTLALCLAGLCFALPASAVFGAQELRLYRFSAIVAGIGAAMVLITLGWIASISRVAEPNLVSGIGAVFALSAGVVLFAQSKPLLAAFDRRRAYRDVPTDSELAAIEPTATNTVGRLTTGATTS